MSNVAISLGEVEVMTQSEPRGWAA